MLAAGDVEIDWIIALHALAETHSLIPAPDLTDKDMQTILTSQTSH